MKSFPQQLLYYLPFVAKINYVNLKFYPRFLKKSYRSLLKNNQSGVKGIRYERKYMILYFFFRSGAGVG